MSTEIQTKSSGSPGFCSQVAVAVAELKQQLREQYEDQFPSAAKLIHVTIDSAVLMAWETKIPHLVLPELVSEKVARLLNSIATKPHASHPIIAVAA